MAGASEALTQNRTGQFLTGKTVVFCSPQPTSPRNVSQNIPEGGYNRETTLKERKTWRERKKEKVSVSPKRGMFCMEQCR
jgi:hypothetical protein